jgi:transposase
MDRRDLRRVEVLAEVAHDRRTVASAARVLVLSARQVHRLLRRYRDQGAGGLAHKGRGRPSNNRIQDEVRDRALALVRSAYADFGPTLAAETLAQRHGLTVSRETLRKWMTDAGLWLSRERRRRFHQPRLRREALGELVQIDGSEHRWFEDRADPCTLLVFIDDATGRLMRLLFVPSESTFAYFEALRGYLEAHGRPVALYSDKHSVFRVTKRDAEGGQGMTQFGRALAELGIEILCANSSQAKGRVERVNRTLQDRLVKELRTAGIGGIEAGNAYLPGFVARFNARFAVAPARPDDRHRPLNVAPDRLREILCRRERRHVGRELTLSYDRLRIMLEPNDTTIGLAGEYVDTYAFADGGLELRWRGLPLPYKAFDKDQRVSHAAIVENKRLGEVLAFIKRQQDQQRPPRVMSNSEKNGYRKTGRKPPGGARLIDEAMARRRTGEDRPTSP